MIGLTSSRPPHVLLVEDDASTRVLYVQALERADIEVTTAQSVPQALARLDDTELDAVITDLKLPGESGLAIVQALEQRRAAIPVVVVSADDRAASVRDALRGRAFDYVTKPVSTAELVEVARAAVQAGRVNRDAEDRRALEMKLHRETLARSGQRASLLSLLFNRAAEGILVVDDQGTIVDASDSFIELLGLPAHQVIGAPADDLFDRHPTEGTLSQTLRGTLRADADHSWQGSWVLTGVDGVRKMCEVRLFRCQMPSLVQDAAEASYGVALVYHDEDRAALSRHLQQAERLATIGLLAGSAAHEIKNDLGPLIGYLSILDQKGDAPDPMIALLHDSTRRIREHVEQILEPLRPRVRSRGAVSVQRTIDNILVALKRAGKIRRLDLDITSSHDEIFVHGDKDELHQIVMNLLINAIDGLPDGSGGHRGRVNIELEQDARTVTIRVRDDGRGISAADAERVFEPFFTTKGDLGTGLGLPVVRDIVRSLSGTITMESVVGEGTTVTMVLPRFLGEGNSEL